MLKEGYSSNKQKIEGCLLASFNKFYCKMSVGFLS